MKNSDTFTKIILSIIAFCLVVLVIQNASFIPEAQANTNLPNGYGLVPINEDGSINVRFTEQNRIDVNVHSIGGNFIYGSTLSVKLAN